MQTFSVKGSRAQQRRCALLRQGAPAVLLPFIAPPAAAQFGGGGSPDPQIEFIIFFLPWLLLPALVLVLLLIKPLRWDALKSFAFALAGSLGGLLALFILTSISTLVFGKFLHSAVTEFFGVLMMALFFFLGWVATAAFVGCLLTMRLRRRLTTKPNAAHDPAINAGD